MSFHLSPIHSQPHYFEKTETIYIDPQQLMALKSKRKTLAMVPSIYQPPQEQIPYKDQITWRNTTDSSLIQNKTLRNSQAKSSRNIYEADNKQMFPQQKIKLLEQVLQGQSMSPNVQFIWKLLPSTIKKQVINFQEGDCIPFKGPNDDRHLILSGEVRIIGLNDHQYKKKAGYLFFISNQTSSKIKQIVALRSTKLLKIPNKIYQTLIQNYLYLKNSEKIKFIQFCPFLIWKHQLTEDLASSMDMKLTEKEEIIYQANSTPDCIYFVKEGIVLLERNTKLMNPVVEDYEQHYEKNQISQKDTILVVRKGMAFGIDGIIIKEFTASAFSNFQIQQAVIQANFPETIIQSFSKQLEKTEKPEHQNPEVQLPSKKVPRKNMRIYTAKTLGKCQLYCLDKKILQTLFSISDINEDIYSKKAQIHVQQLERMSIEYTNMILNNIHNTVAHVPLKKKQLVLKIDSKTFPKSKSLAQLQHKRNNNSELKNRKLNFSPKLFKIKNKSKNQSLEQNAKNDAQIRYQYNANEQREKIQLRNRILIQRQKEKLMRVKKANNSNLCDRRNNQDGYILPKIGSDSNQIISSSVKKKKSNEQKLKLDSIIDMKLRQSIKSYQKAPSLQKKTSSILTNNQFSSRQPQISMLIAQSKDPKSNTTFFNIRSYKSIISVYEPSHNH